MEHCLIGLDWGISLFRAYLVDCIGEVVDTVASQDGILKVKNQSFEAVLEASVGHWLDLNPDAPILSCGMIGSNQGWMEAPYVNCPVGLAEIANHLPSLRTQQDRRIWFVPGVMRRSEDSTPDVMRGEETQIFGALKNDSGSYMFILPGTHSKWALVEKGKIMRFMTFMTGELFALLCNHSILGRLMEEGEPDDDAFSMGLEGAARALTKRQGLLSKLFSVRSLGLFNEQPKTGLRSYLSGLLIGAEIAEATCQIQDKTVLHLVGDSHLSRLYAKALDALGWSSKIEPGNPTADGLALIAKEANLI